jgi:hypothetical protein
VPLPTTGHIMQESFSNANIDELLGNLASALCQERSALTQIDTEGIQRAAAIKVALSEALTHRREQLTDAHRKRLAEIQSDVRHNLILLVHARDCVQNRLSILTGRPPQNTGPFQSAAAPSVRLNLRG